MGEDESRTASERRSAHSAVPLMVQLMRRWRFILGVVAGAIVLTLLFALLRPELYTARIVLYQSQSGGVSPVDALAGRLPAGLLAGIGGREGGNQRLIGLVLRSRALGDSLVRRVGSAERVDVEQLEDGSIVIHVTDTDPQLAARFANAYPEEINAVASRMTLRTADRRRVLLERQLADARTRLEQVEQRMLRFEQAQGGGELKEQTTATIETAVQLQREIMEMEIRVSQLRRTATADNPELRAAVADLEARRVQLRRLQSRGSGWSMLPALEESPELKVEAMRILRDFTEAEQIYASLSAALASNQIEAHGMMPAVEVLDPAVVPRAPTPFNYRLAFGLALVLGFTLSIGWILVGARLRAARNDARFAPLFAEWERLTGTLRSGRLGRGRRTATPNTPSGSRESSAGAD